MRSLNKTITIMLIIVGLALLIGGCSSSKETIKTTIDGHPAWIEQGGGFTKEGSGYIVTGVGTADNRGNISVSMLRTMADTRARADIVQTLNNNLQNLNKIYEGLIKQADVAEGEEFAVTGIKSFSEMDLYGATIIDHYDNKDDHTYYSLASMNIEEFSKLIDNMKKLSEKAKTVIKEHAEEVFQEMNEISAMRGNN